MTQTKQQRRKTRQENWNDFRLKSSKMMAWPYYIGDTLAFAKPFIDPVVKPFLATLMFNDNSNDITKSFKENAFDILPSVISPSGLLNIAGMTTFFIASTIIKKRNDTPKGLLDSNIACTIAFGLLAASTALSGNTGGMWGMAIGAGSSVWLAINGYSQMDKNKKKPIHTSNNTVPNKNKFSQFISNSKELCKKIKKTIKDQAPKAVEKTKNFIDNGISIYKKYPNSIPGLTMTIGNIVALKGSITTKDPVFTLAIGAWVIGNMLMVTSRQENKPANDNNKKLDNKNAAVIQAPTQDKLTI